MNLKESKLPLGSLLSFIQLDNILGFLTNVCSYVSRADNLHVVAEHHDGLQEVKGGPYIVREVTAVVLIDLNLL